MRLSARPFLPGERQATADAQRLVLAIHPEGEGQRLVQTFRPTAHGWLGYLELPVGCSENVLLNVKIREGGLGGLLLYEANVSGLQGPVNGTFRLIQVYNPAVTPNGLKLNRNKVYAFEPAAFPASENQDERTCGMNQGPAGDSYARGQGFYQDPFNGPAFLPLPDGALGSNEDLPFVTLVR